MADEPSAANHRVLGTLVLISLAVIFLPLFFSSDDEFFTEDESFIPDPPDRLKTIIYQINDDGVFVPVGDPIEHTVDEVQAETEAVAVVLPEVTTKQSIQAESKNRPELTVVPPPAAVVVEKPSELKSWMVQVGSFGRQSNAEVLRDKIRKSGYAAYLDKRSGSNGDIWRVRVGPYALQSEATQVQAKLEKEYKITALLVRHR
jgi:DedD protein